MIIYYVAHPYSGKPDRIYETLKHIEITAADYNKGVKYCLIKYPYKDIKPARDGLSSCKIRYVWGQPIRNLIRSICAWWRRLLREGERKCQ